MYLHFYTSFKNWKFKNKYIQCAIHRTIGIRYDDREGKRGGRGGGECVYKKELNIWFATGPFVFSSCFGNTTHSIWLILIFVNTKCKTFSTCSCSMYMYM